MGSNAVTYMAGSIFSSNYLHLIGRENSMVLGMLLILVQQIGLFAVSFINQPVIFFILSVLFQMIGGIGSGSNSVASMAMVIADAGKADREKHIGLIETTTGIGFLIGPVWGSLMYQIGGYAAPFACSGKFIIVVICLDKSNSNVSFALCGLLADSHV